MQTFFARFRSRLLLPALLFPSLIMGCGGGDDPPPPAEGAAEAMPMASNADGTPSTESSSPSFGSNDPNTLVAIGNSITAGALVWVSYPSRLSGILGKNVINSGVAGALSSAASGQARSAIGRNPAYLLIMFGTNDVFREVPADTVAANVRAAVQVAKSNNTIPVVATIPPFTRSEFQNSLVNSYNSRLRSMAASEGALIADVNGQFGSGSGLLQDDGFHPNDTGTQLIAFAFADAVR
jgi:lysophospholipase L1-like esterase